MDINQDRLWSDIQELGRIGRSPDGGITRLAFTPQDRQAQDWLEARMRDAGLAVREDAAGNLIGELCGSRPEKPCVMCGSHYDTVPGGGQFDGTLGILSALEAVRRIREQGTVTERTIRLAAFKDEEGSRFGYGMVGSKSICGILDPEGLTSVDKDGISLEQAMADYGCRPGQLASCKMEDVGTYLELHIEQGPRLDKEPVNRAAVVTGIRGYLRHKRCRVEGETAHSGAVDYEFRHDAVAALTDLLYVMNRHWEAWLHDGKDLVFTCGVINTPSTADISIISGDVSFGLDMRSLSMETIRAFHDLLLEEAAAIEDKRGVKFIFDDVIVGEAARPDAILFNRLVKAAKDHGIPHLQMASGAGHDAAVMTSAGVSACMLFVANQNGSHNPHEAMRISDFLSGAEILMHAVVDYD